MIFRAWVINFSNSSCATFALLATGFSNIPGSEAEILPMTMTAVHGHFGTEQLLFLNFRSLENSRWIRLFFKNFAISHIREMDPNPRNHKI